jgi:hypothetical protein
VFLLNLVLPATPPLLVQAQELLKVRLPIVVRVKLLMPDQVQLKLTPLLVVVQVMM